VEEFAREEARPGRRFAVAKGAKDGTQLSRACIRAGGAGGRKCPA